MTVLPIILAAMIKSGTPGEFVARPDWAGDSAIFVPGSEEYYYGMTSIAIPTLGRVYRDGIAVTNEDLLPVVLADTGSGYGYSYWPRYADFDRKPDYAVDDKQPIFYGRFDMTWPADCITDEYDHVYYFYGTNSVDFPLARELYFPRSRRFDENDAAATFSTYDAYFERLYYASQGQSNVWSTVDWGRTTPGWLFDFNPVNDYVRDKPHFELEYPTNVMSGSHGPNAVTASRRLLEYHNLTNLQARVKAMFPSQVETNAEDEYGDKLPPDYANAAWLYRPGWLLDAPRGYTELTPSYFSRSYLWWSTTASPPTVTQRVDGVEQVFGPQEVSLFPEFDVWKTWDFKEKWPVYAVTLDMPIAGQEFLTLGAAADNPCKFLLRQLHDRDYGFDFPPYPFNCTLAEWIAKNNYVIAQERIGKIDARNRYFSEYWDTPTRRLKPGPWAGINNLLAMMDRTIAIPAMSLDTTVNHYSVTRNAEFAGPATSVRFETDEESGELFAVLENDSFILPRVANGHSITNTGTSRRSDFLMSADPPGAMDFALGHGSMVTLGTSVSLGARALKRIVELSGLPTNVYHQIIILGVGSGTQYYGCRVMADVDDIPALPCDIGRDYLDEYPHAIEELTVLYSPTGSMHRAYSYSNPASHRVLIGPSQPGVDSSDRVKVGKVATVGMMHISNHGNLFKSVISDYMTRQGLEDACEDFAAKTIEDMHEKEMEMLDADPLVPTEYAPLPNSVRLTLGNRVPLTPMGDNPIFFDSYPHPYSIDKEYYVGYFAVTDAVWCVTNGVTDVTEDRYDVDVGACVVTMVAPDGWRWVTDAWTNTVSEYRRAHEEYSIVSNIVAEAEGIPNIGTGRKWPNEPGYPVERTEYTNYTDFAITREISGFDHSGWQTNIVMYYDIHLQITNTVTTLTKIEWTTATTNDVMRHYNEWQAVRTYTEFLSYPTAVETRHEAFLVDKLLFCGGRGDDWYASYVYKDPIDGTLRPIESTYLPHPIGTSSKNFGYSFPVRSVDYTVPPSPTVSFYATALFKIMTQVDWDWKSMHLIK